MLLLTCPHCGVSAEETEFHPGGEAHLTRVGPEGDDASFAGYMFERRNPRGVHFERWRHVFGCGKWFHVARCTVTLEIFGAYRADVSAPPAEIIEKIQARRPGWTPEGEDA
ncbi:sarcosine oxidase subunit delta [uncultured Albimonas sp.]|uniref:sarcosine oxidase subunit delta n=1 Tax=uncultured Albimonas sp. TaxID=1331701 RepID=UPI0030ED95BB|tara:strand:- start:7292 stop:7624 length:333 start_codon:yes stop_codon:yes gene_type:complete